MHDAAIPRLDDNHARWLAARAAHPADPADPLGCNRSFMLALEHFRAGIEAGARTELVTWIAEDKPDTDRTVLIFAVNADVELVIDGFWSEDCWHNAEGWALHKTKVPAWAEKPRGPRLAAAGVAS